MLKKVLILGDRQPLGGRLINLGDRALTQGLHDILRSYQTFELDYTEWKSFPYFNYKQLQKELDNNNIEQALDNWFTQLQVQASKQSIIEKITISLLNSFIFKNPLVNKIEQAVIKRRTRGIMETLTPYFTKYHRAKTFINKVNEADIVLCSGAGLIAEHLRHYVPMIMFEIYAAHKLNKPVYVVNQTVDVKDRALSDLVKFVYSKVDMHITREMLSAERIKSYAIPEEKIISSVDAAFGVNINQTNEIKLPDKFIALNIRGDRPVNIEQLQKIIDHISTSFEEKIVAMPTCPPHDNKILSQLTKIEQIPTNYDYPEVIKALSKAKFVITDRYHGVIFSILAETPVISISATTHKLDGLAKQIDYPLKPLSDFQLQPFVNKLKNLTENYASIKQKTTESKHFLQNKVKEDYKIITEV